MLRDIAARLVGIPALGIAIPRLTGLMGGLTPSDSRYWIGTFYFIGVSFLIWQGTRALWIPQRKRFDWAHRPVAKLGVLLATVLLYPAVVTLALFPLWFRLAGLAIDRAAVIEGTVVCIIGTLFVVHVYETTDLVHRRAADAVSVERLERARAEAELAAIKAQVDPHFLFNSLNTLAQMIPTNSPGAERFATRLARVYRYLLRSRASDLVPLAEELEFLEAYLGLLRVRYDGGLRWRTSNLGDPESIALPPVSLQVLVENAVKHNQFDADHPLELTLERRGVSLLLSHALRPRPHASPGSGLGLANLDERCRRATGHALEIERTADRFTVAVPVIPIEVRVSPPPPVENERPLETAAR